MPKSSQEKFRVEKVIKRKGDKLYVKWKGYNNSFNSWINSLKTKVDKLYIDKLAAVPVDLSKLSDVVKNDVVKKAAYDKLAAKVNNVDTSVFVLKTDKTE